MIVEAIRQFFERHHIGPCRIVAACSGGIDSTALLLALSDLRSDGYEILCGHVNHHLRGEDSDADEQFLRDLCMRLGVPVEVYDGSLDPVTVRRSGLEAAAREVRHERLQRLRGVGYIATAHQRNDQAETVIMRIITGTGLAGLRGIHPVRDDGVIRPLIDVTRDDIDAFLAGRSVSPRIDRMNEDPRFLRNRVRAALRNLGTGAIERIAGVAAQAQQLWPHVELAIDMAEREHVCATDDEARFKSWPDDPWMRQALLQRHIHRLDAHSRDVSAHDLERLAASVESVDRVSVTKSLELVRRDGAVVLRARPQPTEEFEVTIHAGERVFIPEITATVTLRRQTTDGTGQAFQIPGGANTSFTLRNRRRGDRFHPLGMQRDKKLKDFLIDRKIPAEVRDRIPLLVWNGEIVWVGDVEISERFKVQSPAAALYEVLLEHESGQGRDQDRIQRRGDRAARQ